MNYDRDNQDQAPTVTDLSTTYPVARKDHVCDICKKSIPAGEKYMKTVAIVDGDFQSAKYHIRCTMYGGSDE